MPHPLPCPTRPFVFASIVLVIAVPALGRPAVVPICEISYDDRTTRTVATASTPPIVATVFRSRDKTTWPD